MQRSMIMFACVRPEEGLRGRGVVLLAAPLVHHGSSPPERLQEERSPEVSRAPLRGTQGAQRPPTMSVDQALRALARVDPPVLLALVHAVAPQVLPADATVTANAVDDPHLDAPPPPLEADWIARIDPEDLVHIEFQGYRDGDFPDRLFRYHLTLVLRYPGRRVHTIAIWFIVPPERQRAEALRFGDVTVQVTSIVLPLLPAAALLQKPRVACFAVGADPGDWTTEELCARVASALFDNKAGWHEQQVALAIAKARGMEMEMVKAMNDEKERRRMVIDFVNYGEDIGRENMAREALLEVLQARGFELSPPMRERIKSERSTDLLRLWHRSAVTASSVDEVLAQRLESVPGATGAHGEADTRAQRSPLFKVEFISKEELIQSLK